MSITWRDSLATGCVVAVIISSVRFSTGGPHGPATTAFHFLFIIGCVIGFILLQLGKKKKPEEIIEENEPISPEYISHDNETLDEMQQSGSRDRLRRLIVLSIAVGLVVGFAVIIVVSTVFR